MAEAEKPDLADLVRERLGDEEMVTTFPMWVDGMKGIVFAVVPGEGTAQEKMTRFLNRLIAEGSI